MAVAVAYEGANEVEGPRTLYEKIWRDHLVHASEEISLIYVDRHLVHEVTSPQAFEGLRLANRRVRRPDCTLVTVDHNIPTHDRKDFKDVKTFIAEEDSRTQVMALEENVAEFGLKYFGLDDKRQGIVHVVGPEQGFTLPGTTLVCGDSHTSTHGAFGALAFGIGTSEVEHVLSTQTIQQKKARNMRVEVSGALPEGVTSKDVILHIIGRIGTAGGTGSVIEFCGSTIEALSMEARMSVCNMTIEAGARAGLIAPDETTFEYLKGRPLAPKGSDWESAVAYWRSLRSDARAAYDKEILIDAQEIPPTVTWGTSPEDVVPITGVVPDPAAVENPTKRSGMQQALQYMGLKPGQRMEDISVDKVFIGSCTNSRIEDLRSVCTIIQGRKVAEGVHAMIVPGSGRVKEQAEAEGLDVVFKQAGFDWREAGCSMCLGMNPDVLLPEQRCASTSNRNFEGRQGAGGRTHLLSPTMAAAAAVTGKLTDVRKLTGQAREAGVAAPAPPSDSKAYFQEIIEMPPPAARGVVDRSAPLAVSSGGAAQFTRLADVVAAPLRKANVDTDCIIPKNFLKTIKRTGLGAGAFFELRYEDDGVTLKSDFVLNQEPWNTAQVLIAGENFGCGSSREHAPWSLKDWGLSCIVAPSFADIFFNNSIKNGILPIVLPEAQVEELMRAAEEKKRVTVDLTIQEISVEGGLKITFDVDPFRKRCLLNGLDDIGLTLEKSEFIDAYELKRGEQFPWLEKDVRSGVPLPTAAPASNISNVAAEF